MGDVYPRTIETMASILLVSPAPEEPIAGDMMFTIPAKKTERDRNEPDRRDRALAASANRTNHHPRKTHRRQECAIVFNIIPAAQPNVARFARESSASYGITPGAPRFARGSALTASGPVEMTTAGFYLAWRSPDDGCRDNPAANGRSSSFRSKEIAQ